MLSLTCDCADQRHRGAEISYIFDSFAFAASRWLAPIYLVESLRSYAAPQRLLI